MERENLRDRHIICDMRMEDKRKRESLREENRAEDEKRAYGLNNRGVTLMELVVALSIIMIFAGVVTAYITSTTNLYRNVRSNSVVQMDTQEILTKLQNLVIDTGNTIYYAKGALGADGSTFVTPGEKLTNDLSAPIMENKTLVVCSMVDGETATSGDIYDIIDWDAETQTLYYTQREYRAEHGVGAAATLRTKKAKSVISENVVSFAVSLDKVESENKVEFQITVNVNGKEITSSRTVTLRNTVVVKAPYDL